MDDQRAGEAVAGLLTGYVHRVSAGVSTPVPPAIGRRHRPGAPRRAWVGVAAAVLVAAGVVAGVLVAGPRSSSPPLMTYGLAQGGVTRAVLVPAHPVSDSTMHRAATVIGRRLRVLGARSAGVRVQGQTLVLSGPGLTRGVITLVAERGALEIRPVLCGAPAYVTAPPPTSSTSASGGVIVPRPTACQDTDDATTAANLAVTPDPGAASGYTETRIPPDPAYAAVPSTRPDADDPAQTVVLPADPDGVAQQYPRFVLGPAEMDGQGVLGATATDVRESGWTVTLRLDAAAMAQWDAVARHNFHAYLAFDLDGVVVQAPLIEPLSTSFTSFGGEMQIGNLPGAVARYVAAVLGDGALPAPLELRSLTSTTR